MKTFKLATAAFTSTFVITGLVSAETPPPPPVRVVRYTEAEPKHSDFMSAERFAFVLQQNSQIPVAGLNEPGFQMIEASLCSIFGALTVNQREEILHDLRVSLLKKLVNLRDRVVQIYDPAFWTRVTHTRLAQPELALRFMEWERDTAPKSASDFVKDWETSRRQAARPRTQRTPGRLESMVLSQMANQRRSPASRVGGALVEGPIIVAEQTSRALLETLQPETQRPLLALNESCEADSLITLRTFSFKLYQMTDNALRAYSAQQIQRSVEYEVRNLARIVSPPGQQEKANEPLPRELHSQIQDIAQMLSAFRILEKTTVQCRKPDEILTIGEEPPAPSRNESGLEPPEKRNLERYPSEDPFPKTPAPAGTADSPIN